LRVLLLGNDAKQRRGPSCATAEIVRFSDASGKPGLVQTILL